MQLVHLEGTKRQVLLHLSEGIKDPRVEVLKPLGQSLVTTHVVRQRVEEAKSSLQMRAKVRRTKVQKMRKMMSKMAILPWLNSTETQLSSSSDKAILIRAPYKFCEMGSHANGDNLVLLDQARSKSRT